MTGRAIATAEWRPVEGPGDDLCRLVQHPAGWMLIGHARFPCGPAWAALDYVLRCDAAWRTLSADISGLRGEEEVALHILRRGDDWHLNGASQPGLAGAVDLDLGFTPATNLLPLRRMGGDVLPVTAAWLPWPDCGLKRLEQRYERLGGGRVSYASPQLRTVLTVHPSGFVTDYPGFWRGEVSDAA